MKALKDELLNCVPYSKMIVDVANKVFIEFKGNLYCVKDRELEDNHKVELDGDFAELLSSDTYREIGEFIYDYNIENSKLILREGFMSSSKRFRELKENNIIKL